MTGACATPTARPEPAYATVTTITFLLALVISLAFPASSYWPLLLLLLTDPIVNRLWRRRSRQHSAEP